MVERMHVDVSTICAAFLSSTSDLRLHRREESILAPKVKVSMFAVARCCRESCLLPFYTVPVIGLAALQGVSGATLQRGGCVFAARSLSTDPTSGFSLH